MRASLSNGVVSAGSKRSLIRVSPMTNTRITTTLAALVLVGLLGACGSGGGSEGGSGESSGEEAQDNQDGQELFDWVDCMAGEGVELPEPTRDANGDLVIVGDGVNIGGEGQASFGEHSEEEMEA